MDRPYDKLKANFSTFKILRGNKIKCKEQITNGNRIKAESLKIIKEACQTPVKYCCNKK